MYGHQMISFDIGRYLGYSQIDIVHIFYSDISSLDCSFGKGEKGIFISPITFVPITVDIIDDVYQLGKNEFIPRRGKLESKQREEE